jgi:hypothetical protein
VVLTKTSQAFPVCAEAEKLSGLNTQEIPQRTSKGLAPTGAGDGMISEISGFS